MSLSQIRLDAEELNEARATAMCTPTEQLAHHFSTLLVSLEAEGPAWLSPEETRASWEELVARKFLTAH